jgi:hypothetical protein
VNVLYYVIQGNAVKKLFREPNIFQPAQLNLESKSLPRIAGSLGIDFLTTNIPTKRPQSGESNSIAAANIEQFARFPVAYEH